MNISEIEKMSVNEKLLAMETIWDSLIKEDKSLESPEWHNEVVENRIKKIKNKTANCLSLNELKEKLK